MADEGISSTVAITGLSIATGLASGAVAWYLSSKYPEGKITRSSYSIAIAVGVLGTVAAIWIFSKVPEPVPAGLSKKSIGHKTY